MRFSDFPDQIRVKLTEEGQEEFWHRIDEFGGVKQLSDSFDYSASKMYNWKSKDSFIPIDLVRKVFGNETADDIEAIKGRGRSKEIQEPVIPLPEDDELLTRVDNSVIVNQDGTPVYQTDDRGNAERFIEKLEELGEVPHRVYVREVFEIRYPKFLHGMFRRMEFNEHLPSLIDEEGSISEGFIRVDGRELRVEEFDGDLHHRDKRLKMALARDDRDEVAGILRDEATRINDMV